MARIIVFVDRNVAIVECSVGDDRAEARSEALRIVKAIHDGSQVVSYDGHLLEVHRG